MDRIDEILFLYEDDVVEKAGETFPGDMTTQGEKPSAEEAVTQQQLDSMGKADGGRIGFSKGGAADVRKYLKGLKKGSTVNIRNYLDKNKLTTKSQRALTSATFKRVIEEFKDKNFKIITAEEAYDQFVPLTKDEAKIAKEVYKDEIKKYDSFNNWQRDTKNRYKISDIRQGKTTLKTKASGIIKDDPNRIRTIAKRGQEIASDVFFPDKKMPSGKTMKQEFLDDLDEKFSKPRGQGLQNKDFVKKYPITDRQIQRVINYYIRKKGLKYPKGETKAGDYKQRKERFGDVTDLTTEETISKDIKKPLLKEKGLIKPRGTRPGVAVIDFAHRISKDHAKALGIQFGTETTGFDSRLINQVIVRPSEIRLDKFYERQRNTLDKIKSKGATKELIKEMDEINGLINNEVKKTSGRLIGVNINPRTQETFFTGQKRNFKLSNLNKTFKEIKDIPYDERMKILRKEVAKSVDAEIKRGFRPFDFKEILGDPKNRQTLLRYAKEYAPDIFSKFKNILNNPMSKRRFALYSKLPAAAIPAGIVMALADQSGEALAADGTEARSILPEVAGGAAAGSLAFKPVRQAVGKGLKATGRVLSKFAVPIGLGAEAYFAKQAYDEGKSIPEIMAAPFLLEGKVRKAQDLLSMSPEERQAVNRASREDDISGLSSDFDTPTLEGVDEVDVEEVLKRVQKKRMADEARRIEERKAGGGIAGIRKPDAIPPESGPNPQGLENLKYYVTNT